MAVTITTVTIRLLDLGRTIVGRGADELSAVVDALTREGLRYLDTRFRIESVEVDRG